MEATMNVQVDWILSSRRGDFTALQRLEQMVQDFEGPVPSDEYMGMLTLEGRPLYIQPFEVSQLANDGKWDQGPFVNDLENQKFEGILIHHFGSSPVHKERWTPEMLAAIEANYRPAKTMGGTVVFIPQEATEISSVLAPTQNAGSASLVFEVSTPQVISNASYWADPQIAVNPNHPEHVAVIATHTTKLDCNWGNCKIELPMMVTMDGGQTWTNNQTAFSNINNAFYDGLLEFGPDNDLFALAIRDSTIVYNRAGLAANYQMNRVDSEDVTRAQVIAKPWLRVHPETGQLYISFDAQEEDMLFVTPSLLRSRDAGHPWTTTSRADQRVSVTDFNTGRATWPNDIQILFGEGQNVSIVWTWGWEPWNWPRTVWMANSTDGGANFGPPTPILETWGPINTTSANGKFAIAYRVGAEDMQQLAVATTADNGQTWNSAIASGDIVLRLDPDHGPGIDMAPNGTVDVTFLAHDANSYDCVMNIESWRETIRWGQVDPCDYKAYFTTSKDGDSFSTPITLNAKPIDGESLVRFDGRSALGSHLAVASSDEFAYPVWIGTPSQGKTQVHMVQIER